MILETLRLHSVVVMSHHYRFDIPNIYLGVLEDCSVANSGVECVIAGTNVVASVWFGQRFYCVRSRYMDWLHLWLIVMCLIHTEFIPNSFIVKTINMIITGKLACGCGKY